MIFDDIFKEIGDFGRGQIIQYFLLCWPFMLTGFLSVYVIFLVAVPDFVCRPDNVSMSILQSVLNTSSDSKIADSLISIQRSMNNYKSVRCQSWNSSVNFIELLSKNISLNSTAIYGGDVITNSKCSNGFIYSKGSYGSTASNEVINYRKLLYN